MHVPLNHTEFSQTLSTLRLGVDPSDLHGSLTGFLCGGGRASISDWLEVLALDPDGNALSSHAALQRLFRSCSGQFSASPADVEPLLPAVSAPVSQRADALVEWCRGFLGGFGLAGTIQRIELSADAKEVLADFGTVAASRFDASEKSEDAQALADVLDFARNGAALLHAEISNGARIAARSLH
ncbi:MAG: UPF0149 family protein [Dokdonella sp.]|uniref:UPF0149 family protein n=1 Tax=Dokdonella sp. TaxID=2291710 RepID=UPI00326572BE